jgi:exodeoxyribonuclease VII large subunit
VTLHFRRQGAAIIIFGNTYPYKDQIKAMGGRFNGADKQWRLPWSNDNHSRIADLCNAAGGGMLGGALGTNEALSGDFMSTDAALARVNATTVSEPTATGNLGGDLVTLDDLPPWEVSSSTQVASVKSPESPNAEGLTIRQLMDRLSAAVTGVFPGGVWVIGEIQNLSQRASGIFLDLAEPSLAGHQNATTTVRAMLWSGNLTQLKMRRGESLLSDVMQDGLKIRCFCQVTLYKERGTISLTIDDIDPSFTKGTLALAREQLLKELRIKGLDRLNKNLVLPAFPFKIGLISADNSRAKSDFLDQLGGGQFPGEVIFHAAPMQGEGVPAAIVKALMQLSSAPNDCDMIVMTRGGGSAADLRWFDAPEIAYAIASCPVPVVAAIGHHDDVCVAEEICYLRQKTPTAAADFVLECFASTRERIEELAGELAHYLGQRVEDVMKLQSMLAERLAGAAELALGRHRQGVSDLTARLNLFAERRLASAGSDLAAAQNRLHLAVLNTLNALEQALSLKEKQLVQHDPIPWLKQGWTQLRSAKKGNGRVRDLADVHMGEHLFARLRDGVLRLTVDDIQSKKKDQEV